jgi:hypothetical protein
LIDLIESHLDKGGEINLKFRYNRLEFEGDHEIYMYACLGRYMSDVARLEFDMDEFIFSFCTKFPKLSFSISKRFLIKIDGKINFIVYAHVLYPKLREYGDLNGSLNLKYIYYSMSELFDKRNSIVHGAHVFAKTSDKSFVVRVKKSKSLGDRKVAIEELEYGSGYLEQALRDAHYLRNFIWRAKRVLKGDHSLNRERDELLRGHAEWRALEAQFPELRGQHV